MEWFPKLGWVSALRSPSPSVHMRLPSQPEMNGNGGRGFERPGPAVISVLISNRVILTNFLICIYCVACARPRATGDTSSGGIKGWAEEKLYRIKNGHQAPPPKPPKADGMTA